MRIENPKLNLEIIKRFFHIPDKKPNNVQIEISNKCNLNCEMCPRKDFNLPYKNMSFSFFKEIANKLDNIDLILPTGWGESFVHPGIDKIVNYLKLKNHKTKIATNGLLLNNQKLINTALKLDYLTFSLDELDNKKSHGYSKEVSNNIKNLIKEKNEKGRKNPFICIQPVLYKENKDILKIIKLASELGVDRVNIVRPYTKFNKNLSLPWKERKKIYKQVRSLSKKLGIRVDVFEYASFTGIRRFLWKYGKGLFRINKWCPRLYDFAYVTLDGKVTPCCALPRCIVGDLTKQSIEEIWNSKKMEDFRKNHIKICKDCEVFKVKQDR